MFHPFGIHSNEKYYHCGRKMNNKLTLTKKHKVLLLFGIK
jgi:hypothetical protein